MTELWDCPEEMEPCFSSEILVGAFHVSLSGVSFAGNASFLGDKCWSTWKPSLGLLGPKQIPGLVSPRGEGWSPGIWLPPVIHGSF